MGDSGNVDQMGLKQPGVYKCLMKHKNLLQGSVNRVEELSADGMIYHCALAEAKRDNLDFYLADSSETIEKCLELLKKHNAGRATFFPRDQEQTYLSIPPYELELEMSGIVRYEPDEPDEPSEDQMEEPTEEQTEEPTEDQPEEPWPASSSQIRNSDEQNPTEPGLSEREEEHLRKLTEPQAPSTENPETLEKLMQELTEAQTSSEGQPGTSKTRKRSLRNKKDDPAESAPIEPKKKRKEGKLMQELTEPTPSEGQPGTSKQLKRSLRNKKDDSAESTPTEPEVKKRRGRKPLQRKEEPLPAEMPAMMSRLLLGVPDEPGQPAFEAERAAPSLTPDVPEHSVESTGRQGATKRPSRRSRRSCRSRNV